MPTKGGLYERLYGAKKSRSLYDRLYSGKKSAKSAKSDLETVPGLVKTAEKAGYGKEAQKIVSEERKPSTFQRVMSLLSRGQYASAGTAKALIKGENVLDEFMKGLKGQEQESYSEILDELGVKNKYLKAIGGFAGDVLLDPTTYVGPGLVKVGGKVVKGTAKAARGVKVIDDVATKASEIAKPFKEAFGKAFIPAYGTSEGLADDVYGTVHRLGKSKQGIAESATSRYAQVSKEEETKLFKALTETRVEELGARQAGDTSVDFAKKAIDKAKELGASEASLKALQDQLLRNNKFARLAGVEQPYEAYFPFLKADNVKAVDEAVKKLKVSSQGYLKQFQAKLSPDEIISSVPEAYARREYQIVRDKIIKDSLETITGRYGKQFASEEEAFKAGYSALREKGQFGKVVGYVKSEDKKFIDQLFNPEFATIDKIAKATGFDWFNRTWKTAVTKYFPAFHVRNWASGVIQNYEVIGKDALNPLVHKAARDVMRKLGNKSAPSLMKIGGKTYKAEKLAKVFEGKFGKSDWRMIADVMDGISDTRAGLKLKSKARQTVEKANLLGRGGEWAGEFVEQQQKMVAFLGSLKQGKGIKEALEQAERAGFDYGKVTPFEAKVLRRLIPFYTFTRKNLELQGRTLLTHPERISNVNKSINAVSTGMGGEKPSEQDLAGLPDYLQQGFIAKGSATGEKFDQYGRPQFTTGFGTPMEQAGQTVSGNVFLRTVSSTNPVAKYIFERSTKIDTFRSAGGKLVKEGDPGTTNADKFAKAPQPIKQWLKMKPKEKSIYRNGKRVGSRMGWEADPDRLRILGSLPTTRFVNTLSMFSDTSKPLKQKILDFTTGLKTNASDPAEQEYWRNEDNKKALIKLLQDAGIIKTFERAYEPKK